MTTEEIEHALRERLRILELRHEAAFEIVSKHGLLGELAELEARQAKRLAVIQLETRHCRTTA